MTEPAFRLPQAPRRVTVGRRLLRWLVMALTAIALLVGLGYLARGAPGYVLIGIGGVSIETSVWFAALALVLGYWLVRLVFGSASALFGANGWWRRRGRDRSRKRTMDGLLALHAGDHETARKLLLAALPGADAPVLNLLEAARAARALGDHGQAERYLAQVESLAAPDDPIAALARLANASEPPVTELRRWHERLPKHSGVLRALAEALVARNDAVGLQALLPELRKANASSPEVLADYERKAFRGVVGSLATVDAVQDAWASLPKPARADMACVTAYGLALHRLGADHLAEPLLRDAIPGQWDSALVTLYGALRHDLPAQIRHVEGWLGQRAEDPAVLRTHGRLQLQVGNWLAARNSLDAARRLYGQSVLSQSAAALRCSEELVLALLQLDDVTAARELLQQQVI